MRCDHCGADLGDDPRLFCLECNELTHLQEALRPIWAVVDLGPNLSVQGAYNTQDEALDAYHDHVSLLALEGNRWAHTLYVIQIRVPDVPNDSQSIVAGQEPSLDS